MKYLSVGIIGCGIGWLIGLSLSPVVSIVITSMVGIAGAVIASLSGIERQIDSEKQSEKKIENLKIDTWPLALLIVGIVAGSFIGIRIREAGSASSRFDPEVIKWSQYDLENNEVARRIFDRQYPDTPYTPYERELDWINGDITAEIERWTDATDLTRQEVARRLLDVAYPTNANQVYAENVRSSIPEIAQNETRFGLYEAVANSDDCTLLGRYYNNMNEQVSVAFVQEFLDEIQRTNFAVLLVDNKTKSFFVQENIDEERVDEVNTTWLMAQGGQLGKVINVLCSE